MLNIKTAGEVFKHFYTISQIPRESANEKGISDFLKQFAERLGLKVFQDELFNLIIKKPGTLGLEGHPALIIQGHLDMVCEKNSDSTHDFSKDPIELYVDEDFLKAKSTTLGADNGIAVSMCMALMESETIPHPPLEFVLTTQEETGMSGAENLDFSKLKASRMINLDSSPEEVITCGSAASSRVEYLLPVIKETPKDNAVFYEIKISGLIGGHSGGDIDKKRGNSIRIMAELLKTIEKASGFRISHISGGMKVNAIPRECTAVFAVSCESVHIVDELLKRSASLIKGSFKETDPNLEISFTQTVGQELCFCRESSLKIISSLLLIPTGIISMSTEIKGLIALSNNIGVIETCEDIVKITTMIRGATDELVSHLGGQIMVLADMIRANVSFPMKSKAWPYVPGSEMLHALAACYKDINCIDPNITAVHMGLECGIFLSNIPGLDIVSYGPSIYDLHTPMERLSISSTGRVWNILKSLLRIL